MKIVFYTVLFSLICISKTYAQCEVPNGNFEQWQDVTGPISSHLGIPLQFPVMVPEGWLPVQRLDELLMNEEVTDRLSQDSLDIEVFQGVRQVSPGALGSDYALLLGGDQYGFVSDMVTTFECDARPLRVTGYFKYLSELEHDSINIRVLLQSGSNTSVEDAIGIATYTAYGGPPEFYKFEADFQYFNSEIPDKAIVSITAGRYISWPEDTTYYVVDEIAFEGGGPTTAVEDAQIYSAFLLAPNPVLDIAYLQLDRTSESVVEVYDNDGVLVHTSIGFHSQRINLTDLSPGMYMVRFKDENSTHVQKIVKL